MTNMAFPLRQPIMLNNGPNPYTTDCPNGLTTTLPQPLIAGDTLFVLYTGATYGGAHTGSTVKTMLGNQLTLVKDLAGLPNSEGGSINQSQELQLWMGVVTVAGQDSVIAAFQGGDLDSQAMAVIVAEGTFTLIGADGLAQGPVMFNRQGNGNNVLTSKSGQGIPVGAGQSPCWLLGFCTNISELSSTLNYSPQPGDRMVPLLTGWPFPPVNVQNLPNLLIAAQYWAGGAAELETYFSTLVQGEYWQTIAVAGAFPPVQPPTLTWDLTAGQISALVAGQTVTGNFGVDYPAGTILTLVPPTAVQPPPTQTITAPVFLNGVYQWAGDWDGGGGQVNYSFPDKGVNGGGPVIQFSGPQNAYWLPYPKPNPQGPASNGVNFPLTADGNNLKYFTIAVKQPQAGGLLSMCFFTAEGAQDDIQASGMLNITQAKYGWGNQVGQWVVLTIPLADYPWNNGQVPAWIYKYNLNQQGVSPMAWELDQIGFF